MEAALQSNVTATGPRKYVSGVGFEMFNVWRLHLGIFVTKPRFRIPFSLLKSSHIPRPRSHCVATGLRWPLHSKLSAAAVWKLPLALRRCDVRTARACAWDVQRSEQLTPCNVIRLRYPWWGTNRLTGQIIICPTDWLTD
jgi:hypothetical protein